VTATKANPLTIPIVIRLTGTNEEIAMKILHENGFSASSDMDEAVENAVALAKSPGVTPSAARGA
jgi:succinyl-CoA synthetase beta subunit